MGYSCYPGCVKCSFDFFGQVNQCHCADDQEIDIDWNVCVKKTSHLPEPVPLPGEIHDNNSLTIVLKHRRLRVKNAAQSFVRQVKSVRRAFSSRSVSNYPL